MSEQHAPYDRLGKEQQSPLTECPGLQKWHVRLVTDDPTFWEGFEEGTTQYQQWHRHDLHVEASLLLFLVRNGWESKSHTNMWQVGYIVGWLFSLFEHAAETSAFFV